MILDFFNEKPSQKNTRYVIRFSLILLFITYPFVIWLMLISYPVSFVESQLSFSGAAIKLYNSVANIDLYRIANILDYGFMVSYGGLFFSLGLILARKFENGSMWNKVTLYMMLLALIAPTCDAIENAFILLMLSDPLGFPDIWAIFHSCFALVKFIAMFIGFGWIFVVLGKLLIRKYSKSPL